MNAIPQTMRAIQLTAPGQPLAALDITVPSPGAGEVLVRVKAAGICHSDAHYRAGTSPVGRLPITLGHEVAGEVAGLGPEVTALAEGDRVCLHYLVTCGECRYCRGGAEQFCPQAEMLGKDRDGGYGQYQVVPARNAYRLPAGVTIEQGAVMMCSSATALHALHKARLQTGETVAVFGAGGLGLSAVQLAWALGAGEVYAVDIKPAALEMAQRLGAVPVNAAETDPVTELRRRAGGGVDVALELIGLPQTMEQAVRALGPLGRAALAGITDRSFSIAPYEELIGREAEVIGVSDHLATEIPQLIELVAAGRLDLDAVITATVPLEAKAVNQVLDRLAEFGGEGRVVIRP
ncbi:MAG: zinc-binding dehydrogenase [Candidatus Neomarinimicrobiota bacterium]